MNFLVLSKELEATQKLLDINIVIAEKTSAPPCASAWTKIAALLEKIESLLSELEGLRKTMLQSTGKTNKIVTCVLEHASISMGMPKNASSTQLSGKAYGAESDLARSSMTLD
jgi:hypothetical protein